jgi:4-hydroxy-4-methyl-2-oxoglutarate aldolase
MMPHAEILRLKRWNTPTVYNGWEQITKHDITTCTNTEVLHDYMPQMGPMVGWVVTLVVEPNNAAHRRPGAWDEYRAYVASVPGPKIVVVQDLDKPKVGGAFWGEVNSNVHRALGCVGTVTDGSIRDVDEMTNAGFKGIARCLSVGHAHVTPVRWNCEVEVFGCKVRPGQLMHADKHGFLVVPPEDVSRLYEASTFMDRNECETVIAAARSGSGKTTAELLASFSAASAQFAANSKEHFKDKKDAGGEWA